MSALRKPMRRYTPSTLPVTCSDCGQPIRWVADRYAWCHIERGVDHAPRVAGTVQR